MFSIVIFVGLVVGIVGGLANFFVSVKRIVPLLLLPALQACAEAGPTFEAGRAPTAEGGTGGTDSIPQGGEGGTPPAGTDDAAPHEG